jgi:hypothetical protein
MWVSKPDKVTVIDDSFWVKMQRWGTFVSYDAEGKPIITSLTESHCIDATRWYLKQRQEGFTNDAPTYDSTVGGKL